MSQNILFQLCFNRPENGSNSQLYINPSTFAVPARKLSMLVLLHTFHCDGVVST